MRRAVRGAGVPPAHPAVDGPSGVTPAPGRAQRRAGSGSLALLAGVGAAASTLLVVAGNRHGAHLPPDGLWFFPGAEALDPARLGMRRATALTFATLLALSAAWLGLGLLVRRRRVSAAAVLVVGAVWAAPLAVGPPLFSPDVYAYTAIGASVHHGVNPYLEGPGAAGDIPAVRGAEEFWRFSATPYTPPFLNVLAGLSDVLGERMLAVVVALRLLTLLALAVCAVALVHLARLAGGDPTVAVWAGVANPLVLVHGVSAAHNEVLMMALVLPGLVLALRGRPLPGILLCALAAGVKSVALAAVLCIGVDHALRQEGWRARLRALVVCGAVGAGSFALLVQLSGWGWQWVANLSLPGKALEPLAPTTAVAFVLDPAVPPVEDLRLLGTLATAVGVLAVLTRLRRWGLVGVTGGVLLVLVALSPVVWPWYFLWPLLVLAAVTGRRTAPFVTVLSVLLLATTLPGGQPTLPLLGRPTGDWVGLAGWVAFAVLALAVGTARRTDQGPAVPDGDRERPGRADGGPAVVGTGAGRPG